MAIPRATPELLKSTSFIGSTIGWKLQRTCAELIPAEISKNWTKIKKIIMNSWERIDKRIDTSLPNGELGCGLCISEMDYAFLS
jgi:hypothetical protein